MAKPRPGKYLELEYLIETYAQKIEVLLDTWNLDRKQGTAQLGKQFERWLSLPLSETERDEAAHFPDSLRENYLRATYQQKESIAYGAYRAWADLIHTLSEYQL